MCSDSSEECTEKQVEQSEAFFVLDYLIKSEAPVRGNRGMAYKVR